MLEENKLYGRWQPLYKMPRARRERWMCKCSCGNILPVLAFHLKSGRSQSCGCLHRECVAEVGKKNKTHGMTKTRTYSSWYSMWQRCLNPNATGYERYGGRGIKVISFWKKFQNFLQDMGERPEGKTLDRYPNRNGNYEKSNCRWATPKEQAQNRKEAARLTNGTFAPKSKG